MLLEPLLGVRSTREAGVIVVKFEDIDKAVRVEGVWVIFTLKDPYPPFMAILAGSWSSVVSKKWAIAQGDWDGTEATWKAHNNPKLPPLHKVANGTGPFKLVRWDPGVEVVLARNDDYWRSPAALKTAVIKVVPEWTTRKLMIMAGDADVVAVPRPHFKDLEGIEGIRMYKDLPTMLLDAMFFTFKIKRIALILAVVSWMAKGYRPISSVILMLGLALPTLLTSPPILRMLGWVKPSS